MTDKPKAHKGNGKSRRERWYDAISNGLNVRLESRADELPVNDTPIGGQDWKVWAVTFVIFFLIPLLIWWLR